MLVPASQPTRWQAVLGAEPEITTNTVTASDAKGFHGTLDYIFMSPRCTAADVRPLPALKDAAFAPNASEPSDHFLIAATVVVDADPVA